MVYVMVCHMLQRFLCSCFSWMLVRKQRLLRYSLSLFCSISLHYAYRTYLCMCNLCFLCFLGFFPLQLPPSVLWYCWLGLLTCKNRLPYNLYCVGGDVKHCSISISHQCGLFLQLRLCRISLKCGASCRVTSHDLLPDKPCSVVYSNCQFYVIYYLFIIPLRYLFCVKYSWLQ